MKKYTFVININPNKYIKRVKIIYDFLNLYNISNNSYNLFCAHIYYGNVGRLVNVLVYVKDNVPNLDYLYTYNQVFC